jgi:hypothetical protein
MPEMDLKKADLMLIIGRPFVQYWEKRTSPRFVQASKAPVPVWSIVIDGVPLLRLYLIARLKAGAESPLMP